MQVFASGKINITGTESEGDAKLSGKKVGGWVGFIWSRGTATLRLSLSLSAPSHQAKGVHMRHTLAAVAHAAGTPSVCTLLGSGCVTAAVASLCVCVCQHQSSCSLQRLCSSRSRAAKTN